KVVLPEPAFAVTNVIGKERFACSRSIKRSRNSSSGAGLGASSLVRRKNVPGAANTRAGVDGVTALAFLRSPLAMTTCEANCRELLRRVAQPKARLLLWARRATASSPFLATLLVTGAVFTEGIAAERNPYV